MAEGTKIDCGASLVGPLWAAGWLFTWGLLHLAWPKALYAIIIWPYYLGAALKLPG